MSIRAYAEALIRDRVHGGPLTALVKCVLLAASFPYTLAVITKRAMYRAGILRSYHSPKPVISIGNITVGGVGKTPLVITVAEALIAAGLKPAILLRGYKPRGALASDEALMLKERLAGVPIIAGADRCKGIKDCLKHQPVDVFICDDAFGHLKLQRQLDIVAIDAAEPFGNRCLLPRGILREPLGALADADIIVLTKSDRAGGGITALKTQLTKLAPKAIIVTSVHQPLGCVNVYTGERVDPARVNGLAVLGFCGIGDAKAFEHTLCQSGLEVKDMAVFGDHHAYDAREMDNLRQSALAVNALAVVTTHKDAVKLLPFRHSWGGMELFYLRIDARIMDGKDEFFARVIAAGRG